MKNLAIQIIIKFKTWDSFYLDLSEVFSSVLGVEIQLLMLSVMGFKELIFKCYDEGKSLRETYELTKELPDMDAYFSK